MAPGDPQFREHGHGAGASALKFFKGKGDDEVLLATTGKDGRIKIWNSKGEMVRQTDEIDCDGPVHCLAVRPDGELIAAGNETAVNLFKSDESMEFIQTAATFQFSVRSVDFSPDGDRLAAAGDDPTMSIITVDDAGESSVDNSAAIGPNSRGLAWDPAGTYVAVAQSSGALRLWDMSTKQEIWSDSLAPAVSIESPTGLHIAWTPGGRQLATPTNKRTGDVTLWKRLHWGRSADSAVLTNAHTDTVSVLAFSPNGRYLATAAADKQLIVWDVAKKEPEVVTKHSVPAQVAAIQWHPEANELAATLLNNNLLSWQGVVPTHLLEPHVPVQDVASMPESEFPSSILDLPADADDDALPKGVPVSRADAEDLEDADAGDGVLVHPTDAARWPGSHPAVASVPMQPSFQPGSCPEADDGHFLLQYCLVGHVSRKYVEESAHRPGADEDGARSSVIDVTFHDVAKHRKRMPPIRPQRDFSIAALSDTGVALVSKLSQQASAAVRFEPYAALSARGAWERQLGAVEQPVSLAIGTEFIAVATDAQVVHVFSTGGMHMDEMAMGGPVVALAAQGPLLAIVWHRSQPLSTGDQCLDLLMLNISERKTVTKGPLPLTPKASLKWLTIANDTFTPVAMDSTGALRAWVPSFGGSWSSVFQCHECNPGMHAWPVGVTAGELHYIECEIGEWPQPKDMLQTTAKKLAGLRLQAPEAPLEEHEGPLMALRARLECLQYGAALNVSPSSAENLASSVACTRTAMDKTVLRLFDAAVRGDQADRALQLAALCNLELTMTNAARLARHHRKGQLADSVEYLRDWRFQELDDVADQQDAAFGEEGAPQQTRLHATENKAVHEPAAPVPFTNTTNTGKAPVPDDTASRKRPSAISRNPFARKAAKN